MKFEKGKVFVASELVDYTEGGVVSKELVHSNAGSVTLFSFDAGQGLSQHTAPFDAFIQAVDGEMVLNVEREFDISSMQLFCFYQLFLCSFLASLATDCMQ